MSDHADVIRKALRPMADGANERREKAAALAALDALVAERNEARDAFRVVDQSLRTAVERMGAAEAERDEARRQVRGLMRDPDENVRWLNLMEERAEAAEARLDSALDELTRKDVYAIENYERAEAAEARVTALTATVVAGIRIASQYLDTDRGDLDGWVEAARAALAKEDTDE